MRELRSVCTRTRFSVLCLLSVVFVLGSCAEEHSPWLDSLDDAFLLASQRDRPLLAVFHVLGCPWCEDFDANTLSADEFLAFCEDLILVKIDGEVDSAAAVRYKVTSFPTVILFDPAGREVDRVVGYRAPPDLTLLLGRYLAGEGTLAMLLEQEAQAADDPVLVLMIAEKMLERGFYDEARDRYELVAKLDQDDSWGLREGALFRLGELDVKVGNVADGKRRMSELLERYPNSRYGEQAAAFLRDLAEQ